MVWASLGPTSLGLSELLGLVCLFSFTRLGKFWSLYLQICSWSLAHILLLLVFLWCGCCYTSLLKCFLSSPHFFKIIFSFWFSVWEFFSTLSSKSLVQSSASSNLLFISSSVLFISNVAFFISDQSFFMVSMSFFILWSILIIIILNSLSDKLLAFLSSSSSSGEFSYSFTWGLFLCLPILAASLYSFLCIRWICKYSGVGLCQMLLVTGPGQPFWSEQWSTICGSHSAGPVCVWREPGCAPRLAFTITGPWGRSAKISQRSALVVKLINDVAWSCNQQSGLSITGWGRVIPVGGAIASPQADVIWRRVLCLRKMASPVWGMTQHRDPGSCSFSSLPRATNPRLFSSVSSSLCPSSAGAQGKGLQMKFCALAL